MITAYVENWKPFMTTREEYIASTTRASTKQDVIKYVRDYMERNVCTPDVVKFLNAVLECDELLDKTHVVWDGSYRQCVVLVRPDGLFAHQGSTDAQFYVDNAELFFLNMDDETWAEVNEWWDDHMDYLNSLEEELI